MTISPRTRCALLLLGATFLLILVFLHGTFCSHLWANTCQTDRVTLTLEVTAFVSDTGLRFPSVYQVLNSLAFPFERYDALLVLNWCALLPTRWATFLPILVFLGCYRLLLVNAVATTRLICKRNLELISRHSKHTYYPALVYYTRGIFNNTYVLNALTSTQASLAHHPPWNLEGAELVLGYEYQVLTLRYRLAKLKLDTGIV